MLSFKLFAFVSILMFGGAVINSYILHEQFFPTVVHLTSSKSNKVIILNFCFMVFVWVNLKITDFIFGEIREIERMVFN